VKQRVVIIGGGVIGLCAAYYCARRGWRVTLVERNAARRDGCSFQNAGMLVTSHFVPLAAPGMVALALKWMWNPASPFYVKPRLSPDLLAWGYRFWRAATPEHVRRAAPLLRDLSEASHRCYDELAALPGSDFGLVKKGLLMLCRTRHTLEEETRTALVSKQENLERALAAEARRRGADVTLISGPTHLLPPGGVNVVRVTTAEEMFNAALNQAQGADLVLKAAAVSDYRPEERSRGKLKKETLRRRAITGGSGDRAIALRLLPTPDILEELGRRKKPHQVLVGFAAETDELERNAARKLRRKNLDFVVANRIGVQGEGFESETNRALVLGRTGERVDLRSMPKDEMARAILDLVAPLLAQRRRGAGAGRNR
jgi:hypothetical protein